MDSKYEAVQNPDRMYNIKFELVRYVSLNCFQCRTVSASTGIPLKY